METNWTSQSLLRHQPLPPRTPCMTVLITTTYRGATQSHVCRLTVTGRTSHSGSTAWTFSPVCVNVWSVAHVLYSFTRRFLIVASWRACVRVCMCACVRACVRAWKPMTCLNTLYHFLISIWSDFRIGAYLTTHNLTLTLWSALFLLCYLCTNK